MSKLFNILFCKCPKCGKSDMFKYPSYNFFHFIAMHAECPNCKVNFEPEPGFYLGAMYISYLVNSFIFLFVALILTFYFEMSLTFTLVTMGILALLVLPYTLRVSRTIWLLIN